VEAPVILVPPALDVLEKADVFVSPCVSKGSFSKLSWVACCDESVRGGRAPEADVVLEAVVLAPPVAAPLLPTLDPLLAVPTEEDPSGLVSHSIGPHIFPVVI
jgi:hypothetical protein